MNTASLYETAKRMVAPGKGILAADESLGSATKRLEAVGIESTEETRRQYRNLFLTTAGIENYLSGVILFDETFRQQADTGEGFVELLQKKGIFPGIKVDKGTVDMPDHPNEVATEGLDGLRERLAEYAAGGCVFTKWRAVIAIGKDIPSDACIAENAKRLAEYARLSQEAGMVPIPEPEVLLDGEHDIKRAEEETTRTLKVVFEHMAALGVDLQGLVLKTSMTLAGKDFEPKSTPEEVAEATIRTLKAAVPEDVAGVVFLSGGQSPEQATDNLRAIAQFKNDVSWPMTFSYARALQGPSLEIWRGKPENVPEAQAEFLKRLEQNAKAREGVE